MISGFYSGVSGAQSQTRALDVAANNIANINTTGYKSQRASFSELMYTNMMTPDGQAPQNLKNGNGVRLMGVDINLVQGAINPTGKNIDAALQSDGFFTVMDSQGQIFYTRKGDFKLAAMQDGQFALVTAEGDYVLNSQMQRIVVKDGGQELKYASPKHGDKDSIELAIARFNNPYALEKMGDSKFAANDATGAATLDEEAKIAQGCLENSSVDMASEMADLISAQRGFQFNAKVIQMADEIEQTTNNLR